MIPNIDDFKKLNSDLNKEIEAIDQNVNTRFNDYLFDTFGELLFGEYSQLPSSQEFTSSSRVEKIEKFLFEARQENKFPEIQTIDVFVKHDNLLKFIKTFSDGEFGFTNNSKDLLAWKWLHTQQNFIRASNKAFNGRIKEILSGNTLDIITKSIINKCIESIQDRNCLLAGGKTAHSVLHEKWLLINSPLKILESVLKSALKSTLLLYRKWVAGVALALANYNYGQSDDMVLNRKLRVDELISSWKSFCKQIRLSRADPELDKYLNRTVKTLVINNGLRELCALHESGTLHFIERKDKTVSERLFVRELSLLHDKLFFKPPNSGLISDLFYLDGMKLSPSERAIQRIVKSTLINEKEMRAVSRKSFKSQLIEDW